MPLQFQYLSLIRFGAKVHEKALRLGNSLRLWEERKTEIVRSLSNVAPLREYVPQESLFSIEWSAKFFSQRTPICRTKAPGPRSRRILN